MLLVRVFAVIILQVASRFYFSLASSSILENVKLSDEDKLLFVKEHNDYRRKAKPIGSNIQEMIWDEELARFAVAQSNKCVFQHSKSDDRNTATKFNYIGENIYAASYFNNISNRQAIESSGESWYKEIDDYDFNSNDCSKVCGHYTQMVWAESYAVGCGITKCKDFRFSSSGTAYEKAILVFCNYGPGGNFVGQKPYKEGAACSGCSEGFTCKNSLCSSGKISNLSQPAARSSDFDPHSNVPPLKASFTVFVTISTMVVLIIIIDLVQLAV